MNSAAQEDKESVQSEILREAKRTTHAVRAIARFLLLIVTYQVIAGVLIGSGVVLADSDAGPLMVVVGLVLVVVGLIHALSAAWEEFGMSNRRNSGASSGVGSDGAENAHRLFDGECDCSEREREESGTDFLGTVEYCLGCSRALPKGEPEDSELPRDENGLLDGSCSCTKWERFGSIETKNGVTYCSRCERTVAE
jgi:hypothetical protein